MNILLSTPPRNTYPVVVMKHVCITGPETSESHVKWTDMSFFYQFPKNNCADLFDSGYTNKKCLVDKGARSGFKLHLICQQVHQHRFHLDGTVCVTQVFLLPAISVLSALRRMTNKSERVV